MILAVHSSASYFSETKTYSRDGGHFFMSDNAANPAKNGDILTIAQIIKTVVSSVAEVEVGALFINFREVVPSWHILEEMVHKNHQPLYKRITQLSSGFVKNNVKKKIKSMDMKLHWLLFWPSQSQFCHYWAPGGENRADYFTKHHASIHHRAIRPEFLKPKCQLDLLRKRKAQIKPAARVC